MAKREVARDII